MQWIVGDCSRRGPGPQPGCKARRDDHAVSQPTSRGGPHHGHRPGKLDEFLGRFVADLGAAFHAPAVVTGDKLGLYKALAAAGPSTPAELAAATATSERYVAEWLTGQAADGYVTYDPAAGRYLLTEEQAFALADETSPRVRARRLPAGHLGRQGRAQGHRGVPDRRRSRLGRAPR
jgi:hypothetical protein